METTDLAYLGKTISELSGIPVRLYEDGVLSASYATPELPKDPICIYWEQLQRLDSHVGYFLTEELSFYAFVNSGGTKIVAGPTGQIRSSDQELRALAFRADVPKTDVDRFLGAMKRIRPMPLEGVLKMLCAINCVLNGEKLELRDIAIQEAAQEALRSSSAHSRAEALDAPPEMHNTLALEDGLMDLVAHGDVDALRAWIASAPAVRGGTLAADQLRQRKNTFIVTATLVSRAAIRGGMDANDALALSDRFIQSCEQLRTPEQLTNLQYHMVLEYTERVARLRVGEHPDELVQAVARYVQRHLSEPIRAEAMAKELYLSRPYLSARFSAASGMTLTDFILTEKTEEAKRLLRYTNKTAAAISGYLGFSSQAHFCRVFRKYAGISPQEYRKAPAVSVPL